MAESSVGELIRERRLALGMSLGQLASSVDRTAASVRGWERGEDFPDTELRSRLAEVLGVEIDDLDAPRLHRDVAPAGGAQSDAPVTPAAAAPAPVPAVLQPDAVTSGDAAEPEAESPSSKAAGDLDEAGPSPWETPDGDGADELFVDGDSGQLTEFIPLRPVPLAPRPEAAGRPFMGPDDDDLAQIQVQVPTSYMADPREQRRYWIRTALLTVATIVALIILAWALRNLQEALGEVLDQFNTSDIDE